MLEEINTPESFDALSAMVRLAVVRRMRRLSPSNTHARRLRMCAEPALFFSSKMISKAISEFKQDGYTTIAPEETTQAWLSEARKEADRLMQKQQPVDGWLDCHEFNVSLPNTSTLQSLLSELLHNPGATLRDNQLSVLFQEFQRPYQNRHVDGAKDGIFWHALLVGVLLDDLPEEKTGLGNPLVWPGSQHHTLASFVDLGLNPTREDVRAAIGNAARSSIGAGTPIFGPPGTILVMDHALVHGMADHTTPDFARRVVYYRLGTRTENPTEIVDRQHFFKPGI